MKQFTVKEGNKEMTVFIPPTGDPQEDSYLEEAEREKTAEQLRKRPEKPKSKLSKEDRAEAMKEWIEFKNRERRGDIKRKYF